MRKVVSSLLLVLFFLLARGANAQPQAEFRAEFNFTNPGARSLGLGGAFVGLADDATAAYANPAGLVNLSRPEISIEGRRWTYNVSYPDRGHAFGPLATAEEGNVGGQDDTLGIVNGESSNSVTGLSFLSFVYPYKRFSIAFYRHELANFEANITTNGAFFDADADGDGVKDQFRFFPTRSRASLDIINYGVSAGYRINDRFSAGVGANYYDFSSDIVNRRFPTNGFFGAPQFDASTLNTLRRQGDDTDIGFTLGLLWKVRDNWSLGAVYRRDASFDVESSLTETAPPGVLELPKEEFRVPEIYAFGTAFKPTDQITITIDLNHINYSDTFKEEERVRIDDADEFHFGLEYVILKTRKPISLRAGAWYDPDHQPSYRGLPDGTVDQRSLAVLFPRGENEWHYSGGLGLVFGEKFQLDAAFDLSDRVDTLSLSSVYRF